MKAIKTILFCISTIVNSCICLASASPVGKVLGGFLLIASACVIYKIWSEDSELLELRNLRTTTCKYLSDNPYIRCAVRPDNDTCLACKDFQPKA